jgi:hypothetical protein
VSDTSTYKNAIWIFGDQHPAHALSCNGDPNLNTPQQYERKRLHDRLAGWIDETGDTFALPEL